RNSRAVVDAFFSFHFLLFSEVLEFLTWCTVSSPKSRTKVAHSPAIVFLKINNSKNENNQSKMQRTERAGNISTRWHALSLASNRFPPFSSPPLRLFTSDFQTQKKKERRIDSGEDIDSIDLNGLGIHDAATLLKTYFRCLPQPLLPLDC